MRPVFQISTIAFVIQLLALPNVFGQEIFKDSFELCRIAGVVEWDGGGDGTSWSDPLNWTGDQLPANGDAVAIRVPDPLTVEYDSGLGTTSLSCLGAKSNLLVSGGNLVLDGPATVTADLTLTGGTLTPNARMLVLGELSLDSGALDGAGTLSVGGLYTWTGGFMLGTGRTVANGGIEISGANTKGFRERTLTVNAAGTWTGSGDLDVRSGATINLNAPFEIATDADMTYLQGAAPVINVNSTLTKSAGAGLTIVSCTLNNNGSIAVDSGQLMLGVGNTNGSSSGEFLVASGSTLTVRGGQTFTGASSFSGAGAFIYDGQAGGAAGTGVMEGNYALTGPLGVSSGTLRFPVPANVPNDVTLSGGALELQAGGSFAGDVTVNGALRAEGALDITGSLEQQVLSILDGAGTITVGGLYTWVGGSMLGTGETVANGGIEISGANTKGFRERTLTVNAAGNWSGSGSLDMRSGATINLNAPFDIATDADMLHLQFATPIVNINSSLTKSASTGLTQIAAQIVNAGSINTAAGQLGFERTYEQTSSGTLDVNIAGLADFDIFPVGQTATLDGTLSINLVESYEPTLGDSFEILTAASVTGTFATVDGTAIAAGKVFDIVYGAGNVTLEVVAE